MKKQEFIEKLESFGLPESEFIILSGGSLLMRGLRDETADFDLCASKALAERLDLKNCPQDGSGCWNPFENVQMKDDMEGRPFDVIEGFQCETLGSILAFKKRLKRPKDIKDIAAIEAWLKEHRTITVRRITAENRGDANIPNEPFSIWGRMVPSLSDGKWSYSTISFETPEEMCFPDFEYDPGADDNIYLGAYDNGRCIGLAVLRKDMFRYLYLDDLKVSREYRGQGVGGMLIDACMQLAEELQLQGVCTVGQDNNLSACLFYLDHGFEIGGFDNRVYRGTSQEDKADIIFYRDLEK